MLRCHRTKSLPQLLSQSVPRILSQMSKRRSVYAEAIQNATNNLQTFDEPQDQDQDSLFDGSSSDYEDNRMETPQPPPPLTPPPSDPPILRDTRLTAEKQTRSLFVSVSGADSESANEQESASTSKHTTNRPRKPISRPKIVPMFMSSRANPVAGPSKPIKKTRPGRPPFLVPRPPTPSKHNDAREKSSADVEMQDIDQIEQFPPDEAPSSDMLVPSKAQAQDVTMYSSSWVDYLTFISQH
jgi:hypothetical protein